MIMVMDQDCVIMGSPSNRWDDQILYVQKSIIIESLTDKIIRDT